MKKFIIPVLLLFAGCNSSEQFPPNLQKDEVILDNSKVRVSTFGIYNSTIETIMGSDAWKKTVGVNTNRLDLSSIKSVLLKDYNMELLSFSYKNDINKTLTVSICDGKLSFLDVSIFEGNGNKTLEVTEYKTGNLSYVLNLENNVVSSTQISKMNFVDFYGDPVVSNSKIGPYAVDDDVPCNKKTKTYGDCVNCAFDDFTKDWLGKVAMAVATKEVLAAIAIHCAL